VECHTGSSEHLIRACINLRLAFVRLTLVSLHALLIQDPDTQKWRYFGWELTLAYMTDFISLHGPFDGLMAFSQVWALLWAYMLLLVTFWVFMDLLDSDSLPGSLPRVSPIV
jgi:hypothetical protein